MTGIDVAVIGGSGMGDITGAEVLDVIPAPAASTDLTVIDAGTGPFVFLPRHGPEHHLAPHEIPYRANIEALASVGVRRVVATCVAGSVNQQIRPGHLVIPDQFVEFTHGRDTPAPGQPKHLPMGEPYCRDLRALLAAVASPRTPVTHCHGTVVVTQGPRFATLAENRWYARQGWDIVNMTQYPEVMLAREHGVCYATVASITDYAYGIGESGTQIGESMAGALAVFHANRVVIRDIAVAAAAAAGKTIIRCGCAAPMPREYYVQEQP